MTKNCLFYIVFIIYFSLLVCQLISALNSTLGLNPKIGYLAGNIYFGRSSKLSLLPKISFPKALF